MTSPTSTPDSDTVLIHQAEMTLGWPIANPSRFLANIDAFGLGEALNLEHSYPESPRV